ncbi:hypothetical protein ACQRCA_08480, partial [Collinsella sp. SGI.095]|uniref:hypothetical protein n=1 Tax=Collinsella sp. SGI.095 TaxID=3420553 RepID=UPI003D010990
SYLLEFSYKKVHIDEQTDGYLRMNATDCYHGLPGEQSDPMEAPLPYRMGIYADWFLSAYYMFSDSAQVASWQS